MARAGHFARKATDSLPAECWDLMKAGFRDKKTSTEIAREIESTVGVRIHPRTIGRRALEWREEMGRRQAKKEEMQALVAAMDEGDLTASGVIKALALQALLDDPSAFGSQNPLKVQSQNLRAEELMIKRDTLKLKEREVAVNEGRLRLLQEREQRVLATTQELETKLATGKSVTPEDIRRIREVYGLS